MKAVISLVAVMVLALGMSAVRAADTHDHGAAMGGKAGKVQSLGGGKTCDKCNKNKSGDKVSSMGSSCCCSKMGKMGGMMSDDKQGGMGMMQGGMEHDAMAERMQKMEERMEMMQKMMMEQKSKG